MEGDGSFSLKNLGKSSIFLNGKEVSTGQLIGLVSSSLIEVGLLYVHFSIFFALSNSRDRVMLYAQSLIDILPFSCRLGTWLLYLK